jgi:hypothetical protein
LTIHRPPVKRNHANAATASNDPEERKLIVIFTPTPACPP